MTIIKMEFCRVGVSTPQAIYTKILDFWCEIFTLLDRWRLKGRTAAWVVFRVGIHPPQNTFIHTVTNVALNGVNTLQI